MIHIFKKHFLKLHLAQGQLSRASASDLYLWSVIVLILVKLVFKTIKHPDFVHFCFHIQESLQSTCTSRCCIEIAGRVYSIQTEQSGPLFYL